jgi:hypothetical protein
MFSLIIACIGILLVTALALAGAYYLKDAGTESFAKAHSAKFLQEGGQLIGAIEMYKSDHVGVTPAGTTDEIKQTLIDGKYLSNWPDVKWTFTSDYAVRDDVTEDTCKMINKKFNAPTDPLPSCSDDQFKSKAVCCVVDDADQSAPSPGG